VQGFQRLPEIHMLGVDIGDDADAGRQRNEGAIGFVRLDNHPLALTDPGVGAPIGDDAARDDRRVLARILQKFGDDRRGGGFAMRTGH